MGVNGKSQSKLCSCAPEQASEVTMTLFSIKIHRLKGCRIVDSHLFSGFPLQGWIHFKYLCKCV